MCTIRLAAAQVSDLGIDKTDGVLTAVPGTPIAYTVTVVNFGPNAVTGASVVDTFPAALTGVSWTCTASLGSSCGAGAGGGNISTTVDLLNGGTATFSVTATIAPSATGALTNTATVTAPLGVLDPGPAPNSDGDTDALTPVANLVVTKTDSVASVVPGTPVTYTMTVDNLGPSDAPATSILDFFPPALIGPTWVCGATPGSTCPANGAGDILHLASIAAGGNLTYSATATVDACATGAMANTFSATVALGVVDPNPLNNSAVDTDALTPQADLEVVKTDGPDPVLVCNYLTYPVTVTNLGPSCATNVVLTETLPGSTTFAGTNPGAPTCVEALGTVTCGLGTITPAGVSTVTASVIPDFSLKGQYIANTASVAASTTDPNPLNDTDTESTKVKPDEPYKVTFTASPRFVRRGLIPTQQYEVRFNSLCVPAVSTTNVKLTTTVPSGMDLTSYDPVPTTIFGDVLTYLYPVMAGGTHETVTYEADLADTTPEGTKLTGVAHVVDEEGNVGYDYWEGGVRSGFADSSGTLKFSCSNQSKIPTNGILRTRLVVNNTARLPAADVAVEFLLPVGVELAASSPAPDTVTPTVDGTLLEWTLDSLKRKKTIRVNATLDADLAAGTVLSQTGYVSDVLGRTATGSCSFAVRGAVPTRTPIPTNTPTGVPGTPTSTPTPTVTPGPSNTPVPLSGLLSLSANLPGSVIPGGSIFGTFYVDNSGAAVTGVAVTVDYPASISLTSSRPEVAESLTDAGRTRTTWNFEGVGGPYVNRLQADVRLAVPASVPRGTVLDFNMSVAADNHVEVTLTRVVVL